MTSAVLYAVLALYIATRWELDPVERFTGALLCTAVAIACAVIP